MPEEATRRLLKLFGMAVTDLEEQTQRTLEQIHAMGPRPDHAPIALEIVEQWLTLSREVTERWLDMTRLIVENQAKMQTELLRMIAEGRRAGK